MPFKSLSCLPAPRNGLVPTTALQKTTTFISEGGYNDSDGSVPQQRLKNTEQGMMRLDALPNLLFDDGRPLVVSG
jgi:hypothetical protein